MNPARIKAIKAPVIASFSGCLSMFLNPENRTETMRPINNNVLCLYPVGWVMSVILGAITLFCLLVTVLFIIAVR